MKACFRTPLKRLFVLLLIFICSITYGQNKSTSLIKLDTTIRKTVLPNGLTYYYRNNKSPANRVELRLLVKVGSVDEEDYQLGLAHFLEHMAFNGTKNFKKNELVKYMQDIGLGFGSDINAFTFFEYTIYELSVPTDKPGNIDKAFRVLSDWAQNITLLDEDINAEREIILEEARVRKGASSRIYEKVTPLSYKGSKYATRPVIGTETNIRNFKPDDLRQFYKDWYRPDLMGLIVIGDVSNATVEPMIRKYFSPMINPVAERKRNVDSIPRYSENFARIYTDNELSNYTVNILYSMMRSRYPTKKEEFRESLIHKFVIDLLNFRLYEQTMRGAGFSEASFEFDYGGVADFSRYVGKLLIPNADMVAPALEKYVEEINRVKKFGFKEEELNRIKSVMNVMNSKASNEKDKFESKVLVTSIVDNFLSNRQLIDIDWQHELTSELIATITLKELNKEAFEFMPDKNKYFVFLAGPESKKLPLEKDLLTILTAKNKKISDIVVDEKIAKASLLKYEPVPGTITEERNVGILGVKMWRLSNGALVLLKKTDFKTDEILFGASRLGGTSNFGPQDRYNYEYGLKLIDIMGYGGFSALDLEKISTGKLAFVAPFWQEAMEGFMGYSTRKDVETLLQLLHMKATSPNTDIMTFLSSVNRSKLEAASGVADPEALFFEELFSKYYGGNIRSPIIKPKPLYFERLALLRIMNMYRDHISNPKGMQFVFVGNIEEETLMPLVKKYIASLPVTSEIETAVGANWLQPMRGKQILEIKKGKEDKSLILSLFSDDIEYDENLKLNMEAVSAILDIKIQENLREKLQGTYNAETSFKFDKYPHSNYTFTVAIPTGKDKVDALLNALNEDIADLMTYGPNPADVNRIKTKWIEEDRLGMKQNGRWLHFLVFTRLAGESFNYFLKREDYINQITPASVQRAAKTIFSSGNNFTAILRPEK